jgi:hypothetical protein
MLIGLILLVVRILLTRRSALAASPLPQAETRDDAAFLASLGFLVTLGPQENPFTSLVPDIRLHPYAFFSRNSHMCGARGTR